MNDIKAIFLDLDGTLLTSDKRIDDKDKNTLIHCLNRGIKIILISGRPIFYVESIAKQIDPRVMSMGYNGAYFKDSQLEINQCISAKHLQQIRELLDVYSIQKYYLKGLHVIYSTDMDKRFIYKEVPTRFYTKDIEIGIDIYKILMVDSRLDVLDDFKKQAQAIVSVTSSHIGSLDVMDKSVNKGNAIDMLIQNYKWNRENLMAFGDSLNDIDMFEKVQYSIAMGNGMDIIKEKAWNVTGSNDENGITQAIKKYVEGI